MGWALFLGRSASGRDAGAMGRHVGASPGSKGRPRFPPQIHTVGAQCTLGRAGRGRSGDRRACRLRMGKRKYSQCGRCRELQGDFGTDGRVPADRGLRGQVSEGASRPPAELSPLPCRGPPPRGLCPAGTRAPPRGPGAAAPAGTAGVETRPSQRGHRRGDRSSRGRERPLTRSWPCPLAGPASRGPRPSGPGWCLWCLQFPRDLPLQPAPVPPPARCRDSNHLAIRRSALLLTLTPARICPAQTREAGIKLVGRGLQKQTQRGRRAGLLAPQSPLGQLGWSGPLPPAGASLHYGEPGRVGATPYLGVGTGCTARNPFPSLAQNPRYS